jgi:hypothetical protein
MAFPWSAGRWACIAGLNLSKNACRPAPHVVEHLPRRRQRLVQNSSSRSRSSGVNSIRARLSATDHAPRACRAMGWVGAYGRVPLVATLGRRDDDPMPTTGRTSRWSGTGSWSVLSRKRARTASASRVPWDAVRPIMVRQRERAHPPKGMISRRPRPGRISPPKAVVGLTPGDGRLPQAGQHGSDSKQGKN